MRPQLVRPLNNLTKAPFKKPPSIGNDAFGWMPPDIQRRIKHQGVFINQFQ